MRGIHTVKISTALKLSYITSKIYIPSSYVTQITLYIFEVYSLPISVSDFIVVHTVHQWRFLYSSAMLFYNLKSVTKGA